MDEREQAIDEGYSLVNLSVRITPEANRALEMAWSYLQTEYKKAKFPKQSAVNEIILIGANAICMQFENNEMPPQKSRVINKSRKEQLYDELNNKSNPHLIISDLIKQRR
jgi:hypothetical protein